PILVGLRGPDHRMARLTEMRRRVSVPALVAAARPAAHQALAQVHPDVIGLDARRADVERGVDLDLGLEVVTEQRHVTTSRVSADAPALETLAPNLHDLPTARRMSARSR